MCKIICKIFAIFTNIIYQFLPILLNLTPKTSTRPTRRRRRSSRTGGRAASGRTPGAAPPRRPRPPSSKDGIRFNFVWNENRMNFCNLWILWNWKFARKKKIPWRSTEFSIKFGRTYWHFNRNLNIPKSFQNKRTVANAWGERLNSGSAFRYLCNARKPLMRFFSVRFVLTEPRTSCLKLKFRWFWRFWRSGDSKNTFCGHRPVFQEYWSRMFNFCLLLFHAFECSHSFIGNAAEATSGSRGLGMRLE